MRILDMGTPCCMTKLVKSVRNYMYHSNLSSKKDFNRAFKQTTVRSAGESSASAGNKCTSNHIVFGYDVLKRCWNIDLILSPNHREEQNLDIVSAGQSHRFRAQHSNKYSGE